MKDLREFIKDAAADEYEDVCKYMEAAEVATEAGLPHHAQMLKDIAKEEYTHAKHICQMGKEMGIVQDEKTMEKRKKAEELMYR